VKSQDCSLVMGAETVTPVDVVRNLGVYLNSELSMKQHVAKVASICFSTYVAYVKCVAVSEKTSPSVWCWRSSCRDWTTATRCWRAFPSRHSSHFKESRTPLHGSSATFHITNTSLHICASCTGFRFAQELNTSCA